MTEIVRVFFKKIVEDDEDKEMCLELFYKAFPRKSHYENFCNGLADIALHRSPIYEWWSEWCEANITNPAFRKIVEDSLYDENIYAFIEDIGYKYDTYIDYDTICNQCGEEAFGTYGEDSEALCLEHRDSGGFCSCGDKKAECDLCAEDDEDEE
jgi:hypothetical protein